MAIQTGNLGTAPSGTGGDTFRSFATKMNENFTNNTHAASRYVGTANGNLMEVGAFGVGSLSKLIGSAEKVSQGGFFAYTDIQSGDQSLSPAYQQLINLPWIDNSLGAQIIVGLHGSAKIGFRTWTAVGNGSISYYNIYHSANTTKDSNGFLKVASPVTQLFADRIESNEEALEQEPTFEKVDVGHYLIKNTEGFSDDGWYIEMPKDANGNVLVTVQYQQLEDNTIEVKTFAKKFDEETGDIVPNLEKPRDIPAGRWIDIRLKALPQPEIEISNTPADFQPTNLAQAVAEALRDDAEQ